MTFQYEIDKDTYVACQILYHKARGDLAKMWKGAAFWSLLGVSMMVVACSAPEMSWVSALLFLNGTVWTYSGLRVCLPNRYFAKHYHGTNLAGKQFTADLNPERLEVTGNHARWGVKWPGVTIKQEDKSAFAFYSDETAVIYMFGKKYLSIEEQQQIRLFAGMSGN